jgi:hypothetical protein
VLLLTISFLAEIYPLYFFTIGGLCCWWQDPPFNMLCKAFYFFLLPLSSSTHNALLLYICASFTIHRSVFMDHDMLQCSATSGPGGFVDIPTLLSGTGKFYISGVNCIRYQQLPRAPIHYIFRHRSSM